MRPELFRPCRLIPTGTTDTDIFIIPSMRVSCAKLVSSIRYEAYRCRKHKKTKMPTGISSLDPILDGGVPPGSVILLLGDLGAGNNEFVFSSIVNNLVLMKEKSATATVPPQEIRYITFTRLKEDVRQEIISSLHVDDLETLVDAIQFDDLSELYFDRSVVPDDWYSHSDIFTRLQKRSGHETILVQLANVINSDQTRGHGHP